jgi:exopolyphosphatase/guanosine-5'-triphosphate,3'-diphosphate pyrophosphatase
VTRVAVVDLGSNSTRLLVADVEDGALREVERRVAVTKLGERVDGERMLLPGAVDRVHACLEGYRDLIDGLAPERMLAYATSAVRDAGNRAEFLERVEQRFDLPTRLLTGEEEALLTFAGVSSGRVLDEPTVIVDLGGGSTEIVLGDDAGMTFHTSLDVGCIRLAERFAREDPLATGDVEELVLHVRRLLAERMPPGSRPLRGIGAAGTVTTLGALHLGLAEEDPEILDGHRLPAAWIAAEARRLAETPVADLQRRPGIEPRRAAVIAAGALAVAEIVGFFELAELEISETDILHGVALETAAVRTSSA